MRKSTDERVSPRSRDHRTRPTRVVATNPPPKQSAGQAPTHTDLRRQAALAELAAKGIVAQ